MKTLVTNYVLPLLVAATVSLIGLAYYDVKLYLDFAIPLISLVGLISSIALGWSLAIGAASLRLRAEIPQSQDLIASVLGRLLLPHWFIAGGFTVTFVLFIGTVIVEHRIDEMEQELLELKAQVETAEAKLKDQPKAP